MLQRLRDNVCFCPETYNRQQKDECRGDQYQLRILKRAPTITFNSIFLKVGNLFGSRRSTIITLYNGAFDSSSALFLVIKVRNIYTEKNQQDILMLSHVAMITTTSLLLQLLHERGIALRSSFLFLSACSVVHLLRTFFLLPRKLIPYPLPDNYTYGYESTADVTDESALQVQSVFFSKMTKDHKERRDVQF